MIVFCLKKKKKERKYSVCEKDQVSKIEARRGTQNKSQKTQRQRSPALVECKLYSEHQRKVILRMLWNKTTKKRSQKREEEIKSKIEIIFSEGFSSEEKN